MHAWNPANYLNLVDFSNFPIFRCVKWKPNNKHRLFARKFHMFFKNSWKYSICDWKQDGNRPGLVYFFLMQVCLCRHDHGFYGVAMTCVYDPNILRFQIMIIELIGKERKRLFFVGLLGFFCVNNTVCKLQYIVVWCRLVFEMERHGWVR